ncbi:MAG: hypothetical protein HF314_12035 [Ignavibacteria bacterium]|jgi:hypothetical protein|nr:hypothetical protein [Ignavibacteria bacterium]MCU7503800.1 hypothetical protein [Ignavibacteria bacterium]MCU7517186.1 hypothetical protein [Ignavibacteria bacterium]
MAGRGSQLRVVDPVLTNLIRGYSNAEFVGIHIFPVVSVEKEAGKIPSFGKEAFRIYNTSRAMRASSNKLPVEARSSLDFATTEHDASYPIDYREMQEDIINTEQNGAYIAQNAILIKHEKSCADLATTAANFPVGNKVTLAGATQFTHPDSDPLAIVATAVEAVRAKIAKRPNVGIMGASTFKALQTHPKILDRIKYTQTGLVTVELLKSLFNLKELYVGDAVYVDDAGVSHDIWPDSFVIAYVPEAKTDVDRSIYEPSFGYTLRKKGMPEADKYEEDGGKVLNVRSTDNYIVKIVGSDAGYLIEDTNA